VFAWCVGLHDFYGFHASEFAVKLVTDFFSLLLLLMEFSIPERLLFVNVGIVLYIPLAHLR